MNTISLSDSEIFRDSKTGKSIGESIGKNTYDQSIESNCTPDKGKLDTNIDKALAQLLND